MPASRLPLPRARHLVTAAALAALAGLSRSALAQDQPQPAPAATSHPQPQTPPELEPFEGRVVRQVTFKTPDRPNPQDPNGPPVPGVPLNASTESLARNQLRLKEGAPFSAALVSDDISRLNRLGQFKRVESRVQPLADGSVELIYTVEPQPLITAVQSVGNRAFSDQEISAGIEHLVGTPVDPTRLNRAARMIEDRYREKGYHNALVTIDQAELAQTGIVLFRIREGERTRITDIRFEGNLSYSPRELRTAIKTHEAWLFDKGALDNEVLDGDVASLTSYYKDRGYLDVKVDKRVRPSPNEREAIITFYISEGPVYTLRDLQQFVDPAEGKPIFSNSQLLGLMNIRPGDVYSEDKLRKSMEAVRAAYNKLGFADVDIQHREFKDPLQPVVDIVLVIKQGRRFRTGLVIIQGNTLTRDDVIRRAITLQPERPLDATEAKNTETRIKQMNLFDPRGVKVTLQPEDADNPGYRDVLAQVQETNTGNFSVGGSITTDGGLLGEISLTQRNFDVTDWPDSWGEFFRGEAFRGGGQTFTLQFQPGTVQNNIRLGLSDPHVFDTDYSGSAEAFYHTFDYKSYTEKRYGAQFSLGERFGSRWVAKVPFGIQSVELNAIEPSAPTDYFAVADQHLLASIGFNLSRSSVDKPSFPTKGNHIEFGVDQYGSPGDFTFTMLHAEYATYLRLSEDVLGRSTTLQLKTYADYIPQSADDVPFYQRYYLGGQTFRGFDFRGVSPIGIRNDNGLPSDDPVGGTFKFFAGAEVRQPLYEDLLSGVVFLDTGTVDDGIRFDKYRVSTGVGIRIFYSPLAPAPFAFDIGFPLLKQDFDKTRILTFSIDIPFR
jgi:outer membrane protein insertion porin family